MGIVKLTCQLGDGSSAAGVNVEEGGQVVVKNETDGGGSCGKLNMHAK